MFVLNNGRDLLAKTLRLTIAGKDVNVCDFSGTSWFYCFMRNSFISGGEQLNKDYVGCYDFRRVQNWVMILFVKQLRGNCILLLLDESEKKLDGHQRKKAWFGR